jgi:hypothetical protein
MERRMTWEKELFTQQMTRNLIAVCVTILTARMASVSSGVDQFIVGMDTAERFMNQRKENRKVNRYARNHNTGVFQK